MAPDERIAASAVAYVTRELQQLGLSAQEAQARAAALLMDHAAKLALLSRGVDRSPERFWVDLDGRVRLVPQSRNPLKFGRLPGHEALRRFVLARDGERCRSCGGGNDLVIDHVLTRRAGGTHHPDNLQVLCQPCNSRKGNTIDRLAHQRAEGGASCAV